MRRTLFALLALGWLVPVAFTQSKDPPKPRREKPLESKDEAKFFGKETWKNVTPTAERLLKEKGLDFVVETMPTPPKGDAKKLAEMKPKEREEFFKNAAKERTKELKIHGVYLLVSKSPRFLYVIVTNGTVENAEFGDMLRSMLIQNFNDSKFDEGLQKMIDMTLTETKLEKK